MPGTAGNGRKPVDEKAVPPQPGTPSPPLTFQDSSGTVRASKQSMKYFEEAWPFAESEKIVLNQKTAAEKNRLRILGLIARRQCLSQRQLTQVTGLRASTIYNIVRTLIDQGLIREGAPIKADRVGPKETELEVVADALWSVGVTLDVRSHRITIINACGHTLAQETLPPGIPAAELLPYLSERIQASAQAAGLARERLAGVGVSVPGVIEPRSGTVLISRSLDLHSYPLREPLAQQLGCPVWIERNVACGAYAEHNMGIARDRDSFIYFILRPVANKRPLIGLALVLGEKIFRGCNSAAGEVDYNLAYGPNAPLLSSTSITPETADKFYGSLASTFTGIVNLLDISCIVLSCDDDNLTVDRFQRLGETITEGLVPVPGRRFDLLRSGLGQEGILSGSALLALHRGMATRLAAS